jgi:GxxExxY protein
MNAEKVLKHQELTARIIRVFFQVYNELGFGFLESVYAEALASAFREAGLTVEREMPLEVRFRGADRRTISSGLGGRGSRSG